LLLNYHLAAPAIIRIVTALFFLVSGFQKCTSRREQYTNLSASFGLKPSLLFTLFVAAAEIVGGFLLLIGLFTQITSLVLLVIIVVAIFLKTQQPNILERSQLSYILLAAILCSLLLSGAGSFALDLPL